MAQNQRGVEVRPVDVQNVTFHWGKTLVFQMRRVLLLCALRSGNDTRLIARQNRHCYRYVITCILGILYDHFVDEELFGKFYFEPWTRLLPTNI